MENNTKFGLFVLMLLMTPVFAQTVQEAREQADIEKAKAEAAASKAAAKKSELDLQQAEEKARLELQAARDKADEAQRKALTESITAIGALKTDTKDINVTGNAIETKALANRAVAKAAKQVISMLQPKVCANGVTVIIADDQTISALPSYDAGLLTLRTLAKSFENLVKASRQNFVDLKDAHDKSLLTASQDKSLPAVIPALLQGFAAVGSVAQTFRTQLTVAGTDVTIDSLAVYGALVGAWPKDCSGILTANPNLGMNFAKSEAATQLTSMNTWLATALDLESEINVWLVNAKSAAAKAATGKQTAQIAAAESKKKLAVAEVEAVLAKLKSAMQRIDQSIQQLVATTEKQPISPIAQLAKLERFAAALKVKNTYVLTVKAVAGGGNTVTTNSFWRGPKVFHSGGAVLAYTLLSGESGAYVSGGLLDSHEGYVRLQVSEDHSLGNSWPEETRQAE